METPGQVEHLFQILHTISQSREKHPAHRPLANRE